MSEFIHFIPNIEENKKKLGSVQDITSLSLGVGAGILAPEPVHGFALYIVGYTLSNLAFYIICCQAWKGKSLLFFKSPLQEVFLANALKNVPEFVMMWCLVYALVK